MPPAYDTPLTDDYVTELLIKDARNGSTRITPRSALAPKPNTRFLKNIIREADGHNAALKRKEEREARERKRRLEHEGRREVRGSGRLTPPSDDHDEEERVRSKRRRIDEGEKHRRHRADKSHNSRHRDRHEHRSGRRRKSDNRENTSLKPKHDQRRGKHEHDDRQQEDPPEHDDSRSHSRERKRKPHKRRHSSSSSSHGSAEAVSKSKLTRRRRRPRSSDREHGDDVPRRPRQSLSPPLSPSGDSSEGLLGPQPPSPKPEVRGRGRGTYSKSSMDKHFRSRYDPSTDIHPDSDDAGDDWEEALEAMRDRQRWQQTGAQRLRDAGFTEAQVKRWEKSKGGGPAGEEDVDNVRWSKKGESREWDRGKVVDGDEIDTRAEWAKTKGKPKAT